MKSVAKVHCRYVGNNNVFIMNWLAPERSAMRQSCISVEGNIYVVAMGMKLMAERTSNSDLVAIPPTDKSHREVGICRHGEGGMFIHELTNLRRNFLVIISIFRPFDLAVINKQPNFLRNLLSMYFANNSLENCHRISLSLHHFCHPY